MSRRSDENAEEGSDSAGFGSFLRGLLSGIPWSESVSSEETFALSAPPSQKMSIHNANGKTRVVGEDRENIEPAGRLKEGDRLVVAGQAGLKDGAEVRIVGNEA